MPLRNKGTSLGLSLMAAALSAAVAFAQVAPDAPALAVAAAGHGKVRLTVTAGPSGAPGGFEVCYMTSAQFAQRGGAWPATGWVAGEGWVDFTGVGTLNTWGASSVDFRLAPHQALDIEIGDTRDETGVMGTTGSELASATEYVVSVFALPASGGPRSLLSATLASATSLQGVNCTYTQGYWKNHPGAWPTSSMVLGTVSYSAAELITILNEPVVGNGLVSLAHQLIAAQLNVMNGANPGTITATIASANALIGGLVVPPVGSGTLVPAATSALTQTLDDFNNGIIGPGHCGATPSRSSTWGRVKDLYR